MSTIVRPRSARLAFTLIELLVVLAIIAILTGLTLSAVMQVRARADRVLCSHRLRQIGLALHNYHGTNSAFPPGSRTSAIGEPYPNMSWHARILPYLEQDALWKQAVDAYKVQPNWTESPHPFGKVMPAFECPSDPRSGRAGSYNGLFPGLTSFMGAEGTDYSRKDGILFADSQIRMTDVVDGTSHTLLVGERPASQNLAFGWWYAGAGQNGGGSADMVLGSLERNYSNIAPNCAVGPYEFGPGRIDNMCDTFHYWSLHSGGANFLFADGSVRFLAYSADAVMPALASRAGGEVFDLP